MLQRRGHQDAQAGVAVRPREHHGANATARTQGPGHAAQSLQRVGEEHESQPAYHCVETGGVNRQRFAVGGLISHVLNGGDNVITVHNDIEKFAFAFARGAGADGRRTPAEIARWAVKGAAVVEMNLGQVVREVRRLNDFGIPVLGVHRVDGMLVAPADILSRTEEAFS